MVPAAARSDLRPDPFRTRVVSFCGFTALYSFFLLFVLKCILMYF